MLNLRLATNNDFIQLKSIHNENHITNGGRLVTDFYTDGFTYVADLDGTAIAYINVLENLPVRITEETQITPDALPLPPVGLYIRQAAVKKSQQNKGIGQICYDRLKKLYPGISVYAFIHIQNPQSMHFHAKNDFLPIGIFYKPEYFTVTNYLAILMNYRKDRV